MEIIDENGRLFGVINVIDALAILLVVAVVVAGIAVVDPFSQPDSVAEPAVRYGTVELQDQPAFVGGLIQQGDRMTLGNGENLTITDTYLAPGTQDDVSVTLRVAFHGTERRPIESNQSEFTYSGSRLRIGESIHIITPDYDVNGTLRTLESTTDRLSTSTSKVIIQATVPEETADTIRVGDTYRLGGQPVGTIQSKFRLANGDSDEQKILLGIEYATISSDAGSQFGDLPLNIGTSVPFRTADYDISGRVVQQDTTEIETSQTPVILETTVAAEAARSIREGDQYQLGEQRLATLESVYTIPTGDEDERRVLLGITYETLTRNGERRFGNTRVNVGSTVPFRTADYDLTGRIVQRGSTDISTVQIPVVIETEIPVSIVENIESGDSYRINDQTVATIDSITVFPIGSQTDRRVILGLTLDAIDRDGTVRFAGRQIKVGSTIPFRTDDYDLTGRIIRLRDQQLPGDPTETTVTLKLSNTDPEFADGIRTGMTETQDGTTFARITEKRTTPARVILTSEDGNIYEREHPRNQDVYLTITLQTRETASGLTFHAQPLQEGNRITLDLDTITIEGSVIEIT